MNPSKRISALFTAALGIVVASAVVLPVHAQKFPERPVRILVPLAAGGSVDTVARSLSQGLSERLITVPAPAVRLHWKFWRVLIRAVTRW